MPRRIAMSTLNASTLDILNTIRANASQAYQASVPSISDVRDIPKVGEALWGYPNLANEFLSALINRIAAVRVKSATFNNAYAMLKKGYLEFGETVEEVFVQIAKAREFSPEKASARELKRTLPDVRAAFHTMNWRVEYPVTIQNNDLKMAFLSENGVQDLIARIVDAIYTAAEYDEFLLFKYLLIKSISKGKMYPVAFDATTMKTGAVAFRGASNKLTFMSNEYNESRVHTTTPKADQYIFMDANFNAQYDVDVLAAAFNMDKAEFMGKLLLIDDFTTFDNDRFAEIRTNSDMIEEVTSTELALMANVKAVLVDKEWFQVYDNLAQFDEKYVASGMYWNYFYHVWKTFSYSPFSNAIVFVDDAATVSDPSTLTVTVLGVTVSGDQKIFTLGVDPASATVQHYNIEFVEDSTAVSKAIAVHPYGAVIMGTDSTAATYTVKYTLKAKCGNSTYTASAAIYVADYATDSASATAVGDTITLTKDA